MRRLIGTTAVLGAVAAGLIVIAPAQAATPPILEQIGRPAAGGCDATHGWVASWGQWMNGGKGGDVCTRTLMYSDAVGKWVVGQLGSDGQYTPMPNVTV